MRRIVPWLLALGACSEGGTSPRITSVEPAVVPPAVAVQITIRGSNFFNAPHVHLDDDQPATVDRTWAVTVGGEPASSVTRVDASTITAVLPPDLAPGGADVAILSPGGARAVLRAGLTVAPPDLAPMCAPPSLAASVTGPALGITLSNVRLNGGGNVAHVAPGAKLNLAATWSIQDSGCCVDQIIVGIAPDSPQACLFDGFVPANGAAGDSIVTLTAPSAPGTYTVRFHYGQANGCDLGWWGVNGAPTEMVDVAAICVP